MTRGGVGLGAGCCTGAAARATTPKTGKAPADKAGALAAVAAARAAAKAANAGWVEAGKLLKKQLTYASQASFCGEFLSIESEAMLCMWWMA